jgi:hypothetical protein
MEIKISIDDYEITSSRPHMFYPFPMGKRVVDIVGKELLCYEMNRITKEVLDNFDKLFPKPDRWLDVKSYEKEV